MVHVGFASACIVDARACVCVSPRVHRVHSVMALCDYAIAYVSHRFALLVVLRASEMHGYACGRVRVPRRWFCLECMVGRRVAGGPSRTITHDFACVGGGRGGGVVGVVASRAVLGSCIALRASAVGASLRCVWRVRADEASVVCGLADVRVLPLRWVCSPCGYARLRVRGGGVGGGSFRLPVCVSCLCDRRCLCCVCMCVVAWMLVCVFYVLAICGYLWYLRTCMFAVR